MELVTTLRGLLVIVMALVPGFLFERTRRRFAIVDEPKDMHHALISYFVHSLVMLAINWVLLSAVGVDLGAKLTPRSADSLATDLVANPFTAFVMVFGVPVASGFLSALSLRFNLTALPFRVLGACWQWMNYGKADPSKLMPLPALVQGWDAAFLKLNSGKVRFVVIGLEDGTTITGLYDARSATNRSDRYPDVFLSKLCVCDDEGNTIPAGTSEGVFIRGRNIVWMQFWNPRNARHERTPHTQGSGQRGAGHD